MVVIYDKSVNGRLKRVQDLEFPFQCEGTSSFSKTETTQVLVRADHPWNISINFLSKLLDFVIDIRPFGV